MERTQHRVMCKWIGIFNKLFQIGWFVSLVLCLLCVKIIKEA